MRENEAKKKTWKIQNKNKQKNESSKRTHLNYGKKKAKQKYEKWARESVDERKVKRREISIISYSVNRQTKASHSSQSVLSCGGLFRKQTNSSIDSDRAQKDKI